ncbi:MAG TPA: CAP domain-containing protein [Sphingomicrobium sp.]|nr:CAP domain-containing protein [Sphingomicrobium sp.]
MGNCSIFIGCAALTMSAAASAASLASSDGRANLPQKLLALHNEARAEVGAPPLVWDDSLARSAAAYGPDLARLGRLVHSPREMRPGQRENLAMAWTETTSAEQLVALWTDEKQMLTPGLFPAVSRSGYWKDVAHYTQMVWKGTTHVGCAVHSDQRGWSYLICRYSPPGNVDGKPVF